MRWTANPVRIKLSPSKGDAGHGQDRAVFRGVGDDGILGPAGGSGHAVGLSHPQRGATYGSIRHSSAGVIPAGLGQGRFRKP